MTIYEKWIHLEMLWTFPSALKRNREEKLGTQEKEAEVQIKVPHVEVKRRKRTEIKEKKKGIRTRKTNESMWCLFPENMLHDVTFIPSNKSPARKKTTREKTKENLTKAKEVTKEKEKEPEKLHIATKEGGPSSRRLRKKKTEGSLFEAYICFVHANL